MVLNNTILRYAVSRDDGEWTNFDTASGELGRRLDAAAADSSPHDERLLLDQIKVVYSNYLAAARLIHTQIYGTHVTLFRLEESHRL